MERKLPGKSFRRFGFTPRGCPTFKNFGKCCAVNSLWVLEVAENSNRTFCLKWKRPKFLETLVPMWIVDRARWTCVHMYVGVRLKDLRGHLWRVSFKASFLTLSYFLIWQFWTVLRLRFTQTSDAASFFVFIFRALRPCDQDSPISACNGNQFTEHPARMTMIEQERRYNSRFIRLLERKTHLSWEKSNWKYPTIYAVDWSWRKSQSSRRTSKNSIIGERCTWRRGRFWRENTT